MAKNKAAAVSPNAPAPLYGQALINAITPLQQHLGPADFAKLQAVARIATHTTVALDAAIAAAFPGETPSTQSLKLFTNLRGRINSACKDAGLSFRFEADSHKQSALAERTCTFLGDDVAEQEIEKYAASVVREVPGQVYTPNKGILKRQIKLFVSYAHDAPKNGPAVGRLADSFLQRLADQLGLCRHYQFLSWTDRTIGLGKPWRDEIENAIRTCDGGLLLLTPRFLISEFIRQHELGQFLDPQGIAAGKLIIPIGLSQFSLDGDLKGLEPNQIYLGPDYHTTQSGPRFYEQQATESAKTRFASDAAQRIEARFLELSATESAGRPQPEHQKAPALDQVRFPNRPATPKQQDKGSTSAHLDEAADLDKRLPEYFAACMGIPGKIGDRQSLADHELDPANAEDAEQALEKWAVDPQSMPFFALLGEYGIGKTTTLQHFARTMNRKRSQLRANGTPEDQLPPLVLYFDLRDYISNSELGNNYVPMLEELLSTIVQRGWRCQDQKVDIDLLIRLVRREGAVALFDGLDEKTVHMTLDRAQNFIRTLWSILPQSTDAPEPGIRPGKALISCRTHYFRDVSSQAAMLTGEDREGLEKQQMPVFYLLPFNESQIRAYLTAALGSDERALEAEKLLAKVHNLSELAQRPYLLNLIRRKLADVERLAASGETVNSARLYGLFVDEWLTRDNGKHQIDCEHKRLLMAELAAAMWASAEKSWEVGRLESWFDDFLLAHPAIAGAYANVSRKVLKDDLRTATFVLRPDSADRDFRFAHTSLQEYFLAQHLLNSLAARQDSAWDLPAPSRETLVFFCESLVLRNREAGLQGLARLLAGAAGTRAAQHAFVCWQVARERGLPEPIPQQVWLAGADLRSLRLIGTADKPWILPQANLQGAMMNECRLEHVHLPGAQMQSARLRRAVLLYVVADGTDLTNAELQGVLWHGGSVQGTILTSDDGTAERLDGAQFLQMDLSTAVLPPNWRTQAADGTTADLIPNTSLHLAITTGHQDWVTSVAWSPDGKYIASASHDKTVKIWDATNATCIATASGHHNDVNSVAWSHDGKYIASASHDKTVKIWDARNATCIATASGHHNWVNSVAWSHDGKYIASASGDNTVKIWDARNATCIATASGHQDSVNSVAWSHDGKYIASASDDETVKIWDARNATCIATASGHHNDVNSVAWSHDGKYIASASHDKTVKIWDATNATCIATASGHHNDVNSVAWSHDGKYIASASHDKTVKIWDATNATCIATASGHQGTVTSVAWSHDGKYIASASDDKTVKIWDATNATCIATASGHHNAVNSVAWSHDGKYIASASHDKTVKIWDATNATCIATASGHHNAVNSVAWSHDGKYIASASWDSTIKIWDATNATCIATASGHKDWVNSVAWSHDGKYIASASHDNTVKIWDARNATCIATASGHHNAVNSVAWSHDGKYIASASWDNTVKIWDATNATCIATASGHQDWVNSVAWSHDGKYIASASDDNTVKIWDATNATCIATASGHHNAVNSVAWSHDGKYIASASHDKTVKIWDATNATCIATASGHHNHVNSVAWSHDGKYIASASRDSTIKIWDAETCTCRYTLHMLPDQSWIAIDADQNTVLSAAESAWQFAGWRVLDPRTQRLRILPLTAPGKIPLQTTHDRISPT